LVAKNRQVDRARSTCQHEAVKVLVVVSSLLLAVHAVRADELDPLVDRVVADAAAGKPLVIEVHAPLCDNSIIACGNPKLGDGDNPATNLYWSTTPGLGEWFARRGSGWKRVLATTDTGDPDVLVLHVYRRVVASSEAWRRRGAPKQVVVELVIHGWRGKAIDRALAAFAQDVSGVGARTVRLPEGGDVAAGGAAQLVAWVGHNRLMDLASFEWPAPGKLAIGALAIACDTAPYLKRELTAPTRVPLLLTEDLMFANAAPLEAAVLAFATGGGFSQIRTDASVAYAGVQRTTFRHVSGLFTNPSDRRWATR
jgi:hypothetical protein